MKDWPEDGSPADFVDLVTPLVEVFEKLYEIGWENTDEDIVYDGYEIDDLHICIAAEESFTSENLHWQQSDQGREPIEILLAIAVQLGIKQGRKLAAEKRQRRRSLHKVFQEAFGTSNGHELRLEYGLDYVKAMPNDWTDEQRLAWMVRLYDDLVDEV